MAKQQEGVRSGGTGGGRGRAHNFTETPAAPMDREQFVDSRDAPAKPITLELIPDTNDKDMEELLGILQTRGFDAVMKELDRIDNPHLEDDFHRLLIQYKREGHAIPGLTSKHALYKTLDFVLLEIEVPEAGGEHPESVVDVCAKMEQLYQSIIPFVRLPDPIFFKDLRQRKAIQKEHITLEIAVSHTKENAVFYMAVPRARAAAIEKQIFAIFPHAHIHEKKDDYNLFNQFGVSLVAYVTFYRPAPLPIRLPDSFKHDPLNTLFSSFSRLSEEGEGASIQINVAPAGEYYSVKKFKKVLAELNKGKESSTAIFQKYRYLLRSTFMRRTTLKFWKFLGSLFKPSKKPDDKSSEEKTDVDTATAEQVTKKLSSIIHGVNIRIAISARTRERAQVILKDFEAAFGQYEDVKGNLFRFRQPKTRRAYKELLRAFIFRAFDRGPLEGYLKALYLFFFEKIRSPLMYYSPAMPMNLAEIATVFHLSIAGDTTSREVSTAGATDAPAPPGLPTEGIVLGYNQYANVETKVHFQSIDRMRHLYTIGQTGTGKTVFLMNLIIQDIENGDGVCFIDPHGADVQEILARIPKERYDDVIYFDPAYTDRPMGLNMLEYDPRFPEQKTFVVDEMFKIFQKLYAGASPESMGPVFEQYFRNAALLVVEDPETGSTLMDISRVLSDEDFRQLKLSRCRNPVVSHFWERTASQVGGEGAIKNIVPYITSKFDIFIANEILRPIIGQQRSAFNFKDIMDNKKILLVNLSKGRLGDQNASLIGLILVGKIMMTALARDLTTNPPPFYLYLDEFQNVTTSTIATILSEARKFKLSMTMAHQFVGQLQKDIKDAVFGNVGTMAVFRIGPDDAEYIAKQFYGKFKVSDFLKVKNFRAYLRLLADNKPVIPFTLLTYPFISGDGATGEALKQMSYQRYGRPREAVETEIREKYSQY